MFLTNGFCDAHQAELLRLASGITVVQVDRNGRVTAQYVPTIVPVPVTKVRGFLRPKGSLAATGEAPDYNFFSKVWRRPS